MEDSQKKPLRKEVNGINYFTFYGTMVALEISESTLKRDMRKRKIKYFQHTSGPLFMQEWLDEWTRRRTVEPLKKLINQKM